MTEVTTGSMNADDAEDERNEKRPASKLRRTAAAMRVTKMKMDQPIIQKRLQTKIAGEKDGDGAAVANTRAGRVPRRPGQARCSGASGCTSAAAERERRRETRRRDRPRRRGAGGRARRTRGVEAARAAGQLDEAEGRLHQLMQGQPEIFGVAFLRKIESEEKDREDDEEDGVDRAEASARRGCDRTTD